MSKKKEFRLWSDIATDLQAMSVMSCKPTRPKPRKGDIIDEDKSVRWNREQVDKRIAEYEKEVSELNTKKNKWRDELYNEVYNKIASELDITPEKAKLIWDYAYNESHAYGYNDVVYKVDDLIDLFLAVLK